MGELVAGGDPEPHGLDVTRAQMELDSVARMLEALDRCIRPLERYVSIHIETLGRGVTSVETGLMHTTPSALEAVAAADIRIGTGRSRRFVGAEHGAGISYFYVENQPGEGPGLHWHPYPETWVVLEGTVRITVGDETLVATAGDTATGPAFVPHCFTNVGEGTLRLIGIHASAAIIQTFLSDD